MAVETKYSHELGSFIRYILGGSYNKALEVFEKHSCGIANDLNDRLRDEEISDVFSYELMFKTIESSTFVDAILKGRVDKALELFKSKTDSIGKSMQCYFARIGMYIADVSHDERPDLEEACPEISDIVKSYGSDEAADSKLKEIVEKCSVK